MPKQLIQHSKKELRDLLVATEAHRDTAESQRNIVAREAQRAQQEVRDLRVKLDEAHALQDALACAIEDHGEALYEHQQRKRRLAASRGKLEELHDKWHLERSIRHRGTEDRGISPDQCNTEEVGGTKTGRLTREDIRSR